MSKYGNSMRINAPKGQKVICKELRTGLWGGDANDKLEAGKVYTVETTLVFKDRTLVILAELPGDRFNSVLFEETDVKLPETVTAAELYFRGVEERHAELTDRTKV